MYCNNLEDLILKRHDYNQANELLILGGFIGVLPVEKVSKEKIKTTVIYGCMKNANLNEQYHEKYINLTKDNKNLEPPGSPCLPVLPLN